MSKSKKLGPVEAAIQKRDKDALYEALHERTYRDEHGCLRWTGNRRPNGYGMTGRDRTNRLVHRTVAWAEAGFPGQMRDFPPVHHLCGTRDCIEPTHLAPATALMNAIEASARNTAIRRIRSLENAVRELQPDHPVLEFPSVSETALLPLRAGRSCETARERIKRKQAADEQARKRSENANLRFQQVLEVQQLVSNGTIEREALAAVGIHRRVYQHWAKVLEEWLEQDAA